MFRCYKLAGGSAKGNAALSNSYRNGSANHGERVVSDKSELKSQTYTIKEASQVLGVSANATYKAVARGEIPVVRFGDRMMRVSREALDRLINPDNS
jgi:excisionase family DNA binding protein